MRKVLKEAGSLVTLLDYYGQDFAFDIETTGLRPDIHSIVGLALYFENGDAFYIVLKHTAEKWDGSTYLEYYVPEEEFKMIVSGLFNQTNVRMAAHNGKFDLRFLWRMDIDTKGVEFDTLLAGKLLDENRSNGLKNLAPLVGLNYEKYQNLKRYKGFDKDEILGSPLDEVAQYAMNDVEATYNLMELFTMQLLNAKVKNKSVDTTLFQVFTDLWMPLSRVLAEMEEKGIQLDRHKVVPAKQEYEKVIAQHERLIRRIGLEMLSKLDPMKLPTYYWRRFGKNDPLDDSQIVEKDDGTKWYQDDILLPLFQPTDRSNYCTLDFNVGSPKQLHDLMYVYTKIELPEGVELLRGKDKKYSTDVKNVKTIMYYMRDNTPEIFKWLLEWRKASKFVSTYLNTFIEDVDAEGRLHGNFNQAETDQGSGGTTTHRLSSSSPNLQNLSAQGKEGDIARGAVIAGKGNVLVCADYNMMELRMFAHYSQDARMIRAFSEGRDLHVEMGAIIARTSYEDLKRRVDKGEEEAKSLRRLGKTSNFGLGFGMQAKAWQRYLLVNLGYETTLEEAQGIIDAYDHAWEGIITWREKVHEFVRTHGYVTSLLGSIRRLPDAKGRDKYLRLRAERQAVSKVIQGSCGEVICSSMIPLQDALKGFGGTIVLQVHDELVAEVPERYGELTKTLMETYMTQTCAPLLTVPMVAEAGIGYTWKEAKG